jgi:t-SNARE complex subunit (syntaxin)
MVIDVKLNANQAENEIRDAEKMTKSSSRKIFWLSMILLFVIISLIVIVVLLLMPGDKKLE